MCSAAIINLRTLLEIEHFHQNFAILNIGICRKLFETTVYFFEVLSE